MDAPLLMALKQVEKRMSVVVWMMLAMMIWRESRAFLPLRLMTPPLVLHEFGSDRSAFLGLVAVLAAVAASE